MGELPHDFSALSPHPGPPKKLLGQEKPVFSLRPCSRPIQLEKATGEAKDWENFDWEDASDDSDSSDEARSEHRFRGGSSCPQERTRAG